MALPSPGFLTKFHVVTKVNAGKGSATQVDNSSTPSFLCNTENGLLEDDP